MPLQIVADSLDAIPEAIRDAYVEKDGKFHLSNVDGFVPKSRLDEFRENNIAAKRDIEALRKQYDGIDPEVARKLLDKDQKERDRKLIDAGKVEELFEARIAPMRADHDKALKALMAERDTTNKRLEGLLVDEAIRAAAIKGGVLPTAAEDVLLRGRTTYRLHDGKATAFQGEAPIYGKDGGPLSIDEWVSGLAERAPHLFTPSKGGGAPTNAAPGQTGGKTMTRAQFDALSGADKRDAAKNYKIV